MARLMMLVCRAAAGRMVNATPSTLHEVGGLADLRYIFQPQSSGTILGRRPIVNEFAAACYSWIVAVEAISSGNSVSETTSSVQRRG
jgi:hypothetical protein